MTKEQVSSVIEMADSFNKTKTQADFDKMILHVKIFFRKEEELYAEHKHPDAAPHRKIHQELERVAVYFEETYFNHKKKTKSVLDEFCLYIKNWTILHNKCYDNAMMPYIRISQYTREAAA